jgi:hypothetical protein
VVIIAQKKSGFKGWENKKQKTRNKRTGRRDQVIRWEFFTGILSRLHTQFTIKGYIGLRINCVLM